MITRNLNKITEIIIHCSATQEGKNFTIEDIERWHIQRGFDTVGYHFVIHLDGGLRTGRQLRFAGAHCTNHNTKSIGICYIGGLDVNNKPKDTRTPAQKAELLNILRVLHKDFPKATVHGHNEFANKACPCFDVSKDQDIQKIFNQ